MVHPFYDLVQPFSVMEIVILSSLSASTSLGPGIEQKQLDLSGGYRGDVGDESLPVAILSLGFVNLLVYI